MKYLITAEIKVNIIAEANTEAEAMGLARKELSDEIPSVIRPIRDTLTVDTVGYRGPFLLPAGSKKSEQVRLSEELKPASDIPF